MNPNDREQLAEQMSAYLDGELSEADNARIREIIETSPDARALLDQLRRTVEMVRDLPAESPPDDLYATVVAQLERAALLDGPDVERLSARPGALRWVKTARRLAAAAIILVAVTIGYITIDSRTGRKAELQVAQLDEGQAQPPLAKPARQKARAIVHERAPAQPKAPAANDDMAAGRDAVQAPPSAKPAKPVSMSKPEFAAEQGRSAGVAQANLSDKESKAAAAGVAPSESTVLAMAPSSPSPKTPVRPPAKPEPDAEDRLALKSDVVALAPVPPIASEAPLAKRARDADQADEAEALALADDCQIKAPVPTLTMLVTPPSDQAAWRLLMQAGNALQQQGIDWSPTHATPTDDGMTTLYRFDATPGQVDALADQLATVSGLDVAVQVDRGPADAWRHPSRRGTRGRARSFRTIDRESDAAHGEVVAEDKKLDELRAAMLAVAPAPMPREQVRRQRETQPDTILDVSIRMASPPRPPATQPTTKPSPSTSQPTSAPASAELP